MASIAYIVRVNRQLLTHNHKMELSKFDIIVFLKHCWKQDYKAASAARKICEMEEECVVSHRVAQRWFQLSTVEKKTLKIYYVL